MASSASSSSSFSRSNAMEVENRGDFPNLPIRRIHFDDPPKDEAQPKAKAKILTFYSHKGGVGKTTNCYTIAYGLAEKGLRVMMIDLDPQTNLSYFATATLRAPNEWRQYAQRTRNVLQNANLRNDFDVVELRDNFYLMFGTDSVSHLEHKLSTASSLLQTFPANFASDLTILNRMVDKIATWDLDFICIDLSPAYNTLTRNVIGFSDYWIVSCLADEFSAQSIDTITNRVWTDDHDPLIQSQYIINDNLKHKRILDTVEGYQNVFPFPRFRIAGIIFNKIKLTTGGKGSENIPSKMSRALIDDMTAELGRIEYCLLDPNSVELQHFSDFASANNVSQALGIPVPFLTHQQCINHEGYNSNQTEAIANWRVQLDKIINLIQALGPSTNIPLSFRSQAHRNRMAQVIAIQ